MEERDSNFEVFCTLSRLAQRLAIYIGRTISSTSDVSMEELVEVEKAWREESNMSTEGMEDEIRRALEELGEVSWVKEGWNPLREERFGQEGVGRFYGSPELYSLVNEELPKAWGIKKE